MIQVFFGKTNEWPPSVKISEVETNNDPEIKRVGVVNMVGQKEDILSILESWVSNWVKVKCYLNMIILQWQNSIYISISPWDIKILGLVSSGASLTSWVEGVSLALVGHPSSDGVSIKIPYGVDVLLQPAVHPIFSYWVG